MKKIKTALVSVYHKEGLDEILKILASQDVRFYSTGGSCEYIEGLGYEVCKVEDVTGYPSVFGGRVKTLHPKVFGGILYRRQIDSDVKQLQDFEIPSIDLVIVDLYPFEATLASGASDNEIIEKIDIGGISLIRAAAKNFQDVVVVSSSNQYNGLAQLLKEKDCCTETSDRILYATEAFNISSHYDCAIFSHFASQSKHKAFKKSIISSNVLRYGENPHQEGVFYGDLGKNFTQLNGKSLSYNNLLDIDAAINLIDEFDEAAFAILKHNNACGLACRQSLREAWLAALEGDPVSAFGGVLICNRSLDMETAIEVNKLFFEVIIAPEYKSDALEVLKSKKNRIILERKAIKYEGQIFKTVLNGVLCQERDYKTENAGNIKSVCLSFPSEQEIEDLLFANILVKHTRSNAMVIAKNKQLLGSGAGQTSRVDALEQAIGKAKQFNKDLNGAVLASDAFFPFADNVEIAHKAGITAVLQPGGSVRDQDSIDYCNENNIAMVFTGTRHFKH